MFRCRKSKKREATVIQNLTFNDSSSNTQSGNYNQYFNVPEYILENQQEYIKILKEQIESLKQQVKSLQSKK
ncbi:hypothetical protein AU378_04780 [Chryseobacterium kwangjuense]|uniref:Uncharacterized protein n=1 Tax=Chryseobacterium kwangjuense TaxID=267125 RepID=A0A135WJI7_9FLAO|nr:hypothetical protein AU378_04780 [Chryseobacterium kwangjuense]